MTSSKVALLPPIDIEQSERPVAVAFHGSTDLARFIRRPSRPWSSNSLRNIPPADKILACSRSLIALHYRIPAGTRSAS